MNGYLRSKCSSEQQLLNELAKLLGAKDVASRKMADVLRALTFFYTSAGRGSCIPLSLLSGLCTLLPQLKDKKEITLLKDEHQRIARIALCLLTRLIDQFEIQKMTAKDAHKISQDQTVDPAEQVLLSFLLTLETTVMTPSGLLLPRQRATLRVYAQLCRVFQRREHLVTYTAALVQQSPVLAYAENPVDAKGKRLPPPAPAQFGVVAGACHAVRFHTEPDEQVAVANTLAQLAFMIPAGTASRHAAKTLVSLLMSPVLNKNRTSHPITVAKAIELYLLKARPRSLLGGDSLTSVYVLRVCGQMFRLPVHQLQQQENCVTNDSGLFNITSTLRETPSETASEQSHDQNPALQGFIVSNALSAQLQEYFIDIIQGAVADDPTTKASVAPAVLLVAIEEVLRGTTPKDSFRKQPNWGSKCIFELVAAAVLPLLPATQDPAGLLCSTVTLHRVCRAVQFVAERLDTAVLHLGATTGHKMEIPTYLSQLTLCIHSLTEHSNAFVACEALRAFVWLLPRYNSSAEMNGDNGDHWTSIFWQLERLPFDRIQPERRAAIAWTLFRRCVTTPKSYGHQVEKPLLLGCLQVVLAWFRVRPCVWHAAFLTAIWHTALQECFFAPLGEFIFSSINEVLDYQSPPVDPGAPDCLVVKQSTLQFLSNREGCLKHAVQCEEWSHPLILRLTKQALLETPALQRMSIRALSQLRDEAHAQRLTSLAQQAKAILSFADKSSRQVRQKGLTTDDNFHKQPLTIHNEPLSGATSQRGVLDDPFSDFRAPDGVITPKNVVTTANEVFDDPFAGSIESTTPSDAFTWNDAITRSNATATISSSISDFKIPAGPTFGDSTWSNPTALNETQGDTFGDQPSSSFSAWGDESASRDTLVECKSESQLFGNFSTSDTTGDTSFAGWGARGTSEPPQEGFIPSEDFSGNFDTAISTPAMTTAPESDPAAQIEQSNETSSPSDTPMAHEDPVSIDGADTTASTETVSDAHGEATSFSTSDTTGDTSFAGWGARGTSEPPQEGFIPSEDFSGNFDTAKISTPAMTTAPESDPAAQIEQSNETSSPSDTPMAHEDPVSIDGADTTASTEMVSDAHGEATSFSISDTTGDTSFAGWGARGTSEPPQEGFIPSEDFSGNFDTAISTPAMTTAPESDPAAQIEQSNETSSPSDTPMAHEDPVSIDGADTTASTEMVSDAHGEATSFSISDTTGDTSFAGWGARGTSEPPQEGFIPSEDFSGNFDTAKISTPAMTTAPESDPAAQIEQSNETSSPSDTPMAHEDPVSIDGADTTASTEMVSDAHGEATSFSISDTTGDTSFAGWGARGTSEPPQEGFIPSEDFSGNFDTAISTPAMTTAPESDPAAQIEQSNETSSPSDTPMAHEDPVSIDGADTTASTEMVSDAHGEATSFSISDTTGDTSFAGWGARGTSEPPQEGFIPSEDFSGNFDTAKISTPAMTTAPESDPAAQIEQSNETSSPSDTPMAHEDPVSIDGADTTASTEMVSDAHGEATSFSISDTTGDTSFAGWGARGTSEPPQEGFIPSEDFSGNFDTAISTPAMTTAPESDPAAQIEQSNETSSPSDTPMAHEDPVSIDGADTTASTETVSDAHGEATSFSISDTTGDTSFAGWGARGTSEPPQEGFIPSEDFSGNFDTAISTPAMTTAPESDPAAQIEQSNETSSPSDTPMAHEDPVSIDGADTTASTETVSDAHGEATSFSISDTTGDTSFAGWGARGTSEPPQEGFIPSEDFSGNFDTAISTPAMTTAPESDPAAQIEQSNETSSPSDTPMAHEDPVSIDGADTTASTEMVSDAHGEATSFSISDTTGDTSFAGWGARGTSEPPQEGFIPSEDFSGNFDTAKISTPAMTTAPESDPAAQIEQSNETSSPSDTPMAHEDPVSIDGADTTASTETVSDAHGEATSFSISDTTGDTSFAGWGARGTSEPPQEGFIPSEDFSGNFDTAKISTPAMTTAPESDPAAQIEQSNETSSPSDTPMAHEDPVSIDGADTTASTETVSDAHGEATSFSISDTTGDTSFAGWGARGTSEPPQEGFIPSEDFSGNFDTAKISTPAMTTAPESDPAAQIEQSNETSSPSDTPMAHEDPVSIDGADTTASTEMVSDAHGEATSFSISDTTGDTSFAGWGARGTSEPPQEGFIPSEDFSGNFDTAISTPAMTTAPESDPAAQIEQSNETSSPSDTPMAHEDPVSIDGADTTASTEMVSDAHGEATSFSISDTTGDTSFAGWGARGTSEPPQEGFIPSEDFSGNFDTAISTPAMTTAPESDPAAQIEQSNETSSPSDTPMAHEDPVSIDGADTTASTEMVSDAHGEATSFSISDTTGDTSFAGWGARGTSEPPQEGFIPSEDFSGNFDTAKISTPAMTTAPESDPAAQIEQSNETSSPSDTPMAHEDPVSIDGADTTASTEMVSDAHGEATSFSISDTTGDTSFAGWGARGTSEPPQEGFIPSEDFSGNFDTAKISTPAMTTAPESDPAAQIEQSNETSSPSDTPMAHEDPVSIDGADTTASTEMVSDAHGEATSFSISDTTGDTSFAGWGARGTSEPPQEGFIPSEDFSGNFDTAISTPAMTTAPESDPAAQIEQSNETSSPSDTPMAHEDPVSIDGADTTASTEMVSDAHGEATSFSISDTTGDTSFAGWGARGTSEPPQEGFIPSEDFSGNFDTAISTPAMTTAPESDPAAQIEQSNETSSPSDTPMAHEDPVSIDGADTTASTEMVSDAHGEATSFSISDTTGDTSFAGWGARGTSEPPQEGFIPSEDFSGNFDTAISTPAMTTAPESDPAAQIEQSNETSSPSDTPMAHEDPVSIDGADTTASTEMVSDAHGEATSFSISDTTGDTSFAGWGARGTSEPPQEGFIPSEDFSGNFDTAISTPAMTTAPESDPAAQIEQSNETSSPSDTPMAHEDPVSIDGADTTASTEMVSDAHGEATSFSISDTTGDTSFAGWGARGTSEPPQEGFIPSEDFSGNFDTAISTPAMTTAPESDPAAQIEQSNETSSPSDTPMAHEDPVSIDGADTTASTEMVSDAHGEATSFSISDTTGDTSFAGWGARGTSEPPQEGFIPSEDFSGSLTTESTNDPAGLNDQGDKLLPVAVSGMTEFVIDNAIHRLQTDDFAHENISVAYNESGAFVESDTTPPTSNDQCNADLEFNEIFGETGVAAQDSRYPSIGTENDRDATLPVSDAQRDDLEFNDIFGEAGVAGQDAFHTADDSAAYEGAVSIATENGSKEKEINTSDNENRAASGIEVRIGTPASDF